MEKYGRYVDRVLVDGCEPVYVAFAEGEGRRYLVYATPTQGEFESGQKSIINGLELTEEEAEYSKTARISAEYELGNILSREELERRLGKNGYSLIER